LGYEGVPTREPLQSPTTNTKENQSFYAIDVGGDWVALGTASGELPGSVQRSGPGWRSVRLLAPIRERTRTEPNELERRTLARLRG
jgi:hypothetical protein